MTSRVSMVDSNHSVTTGDLRQVLRHCFRLLQLLSSYDVEAAECRKQSDTDNKADMSNLAKQRRECEQLIVALGLSVKKQKIDSDLTSQQIESVFAAASPLPGRFRACFTLGARSGSSDSVDMTAVYQAQTAVTIAVTTGSISHFSDNHENYHLSELTRLLPKFA